MSYPRPSTGNRAPFPTAAPQSLEAALDEERREVMAALDSNKRSASPALGLSRTATPPPLSRSMLDLDSPPTPRHGSIAGIGVGITSPNISPTQIRKKPLNPADPSTWTKRHSSTSGSNSPTEERKPPRQRATSDSAKKGLPKIPDEETKDVEHSYKFDMSNTPTLALPKRTTQATARPREGSGGAMAAALSGDFSHLHVGLPKGVASGRHNSTAGVGGSSRSPSSRIRRSAMAPQSPGSPPSIHVTDAGKQADRDKADRKLKKAAAIGSGSFSGGSDEGGRLEKDNLDEDEDAVESSEEEYELSSEEDEDEEMKESAATSRARGRRKRRADSDADEPGDGSLADEDPVPRSQMAAAEQEGIDVSSNQRKSMLEPDSPEISVTGPSGESIVQKKTTVHPPTSFDHSISAATSQASTSDNDPEMGDITKARKLAINVSSIDSNVPDRVMQVILRGDWAAIQAEADDERRRQRSYLVASDLSDEAVYALEWTIGTILRDGDTLLALYVIEDESAADRGSGSSKGPQGRDSDSLHAEGTRAARDAEQTMDTLTKKTEQTTKTGSPNALGPVVTTHFHPATETESVAGSVDARRVSKAQMERLRACDTLRATCIKLVRKTRLQVRIMVEVIHCKSPKHLITGAIDELEPTLVVLGSRGRSALKGTLLGSMSNYIVTKSSVPVMVARKKLKKHVKSKASAGGSSNKLFSDGGEVSVRLTNNLVLGGVQPGRRKLKDADVERNVYGRKVVGGGGAGGR